MPEAVTTFLPLVAIVALFWLLVIRPTQRRNKALDAMRRSIQPGDRVMMSSGIYGTVRSMEDSRATLEIANGVLIEIAAAAIAQKDEPAVTDPTADPSTKEDS